jgi:hypothetical protein
MKQNLKRNSRFDRRKFVGGMLRGALVAAVAPNFIPLRVLAGEDTPSKKVQLGHIGVGGQGTGLLRNFLLRWPSRIRFVRAAKARAS